MAIRHLFLLFIVCIAYGDDQHLICKQVNDIFSDENPQISRRTGAIVQGRDGKRGIPGFKGARGDLGPPGPPAVVNYAQIQDSVQRNFSSEIAALSKKVDTLASAMEKVLTVENCDVFYGGKCFRAFLHDTQDVNFAAAQAMCRDIGWELANVYGATHYDMIRDYLREKIPSSLTYNAAWLGMTIIPQTKEMRYLSERKASYVGLRWYPGYPSSSATVTKIAIVIRRDPASNSQGIHNFPPSSTRLGAVCEI